MSQSTADESDTMTTDIHTSGDEQEGRHPAVRVLAAELRDASYQYKTEDSDRAPKYTLLPTGKRVNRVLAIGAVVNVDPMETDGASFVRAEVHDGSDYFYINASQYQQEEANTLRSLDTPARVAVVGKLNHWQNQDGQHRIEIQPEQVLEVEQESRYEWILETVTATHDRVQRFGNVTEEEFENGTAPTELQLAYEQYDVDVSQYLDTARDVINATILADEE